ncbi:hypothetical protein MNJPNG_20435 [Cupriavidus oxalaticus]|uniref:helix-turn-helix domain-containing protein n=1 Tax=Cupriavidus oxalaticus TaxID=96344 RepID=UPI003F73CAC3
MAKYDEQFKLKVVRQYLAGRAGFKAIAAEHGIGHSLVERWVASYRQHGRVGLRKKFSHYSAEFRLAVLQRMWQEGLSIAQTAAVFDIRSPGCIGVWEHSYHSGGMDALSPRPRGRPASGFLAGELLDAFDDEGQRFGSIVFVPSDDRVKPISISRSTSLSSTLSMIPDVEPRKEPAIGLGVAQYRGYAASALGVSARINQRLKLKAGASLSAAGNAYGAGASYQWQSGIEAASRPSMDHPCLALRCLTSLPSVVA